MSCPLLCLPGDVQARIIAELNVCGNLSGARALLSLRLASKRAACFGRAAAVNIGLEYALVCGQLLVLYPHVWELQALLVRASMLWRSELLDPSHPAACSWIAEFGCPREQLFRRMLARAEVVQAGIAKHRGQGQRHRGGQVVCWVGGSPVSTATHFCKLLASMQQDADRAVADWRYRAALGNYQQAAAELQATLALRPGPMRQPGCHGLRSRLRRLFCCSLPRTV